MLSAVSRFVVYSELARSFRVVHLGVCRRLQPVRGFLIEGAMVYGRWHQDGQGALVHWCIGMNDTVMSNDGLSMFKTRSSRRNEFWVNSNFRNPVRSLFGVPY